MVFVSSQYWQEPHNGNITWIHEDGSKPFCVESGQTIVSQKLPPSPSSAGTVPELGHIQVQDTALYLSTLAGWKAIAPCTRSTGCEPWAGLWASNLGWPRCIKLTMPAQCDDDGHRQLAMMIRLVLQAVSSRIPLKFFVHPGSHRAKESWSVQNAVKQANCVFWHQTFPNISKTHWNNKIIPNGIPSIGYQGKIRL